MCCHGNINTSVIMMEIQAIYLKHNIKKLVPWAIIKKK